MRKQFYVWKTLDDELGLQYSESSWDNKHLVFLNCSETNCHLNGNYDDDVSVKVLYNCSFTVTSFQFHIQ